MKLSLLLERRVERNGQRKLHKPLKMDVDPALPHPPGVGSANWDL